MIQNTEIYSYNFFTYSSPFYGSCQGMRYRICRESRGEGEDVFRISVWKEPFGYDATPEEEKTHVEFPFDEENYEKIVPWLNEQLTSRKWEVWVYKKLI